MLHDQEHFLSRILPPIQMAAMGQLQPCYYAIGLREGMPPQQEPFLRVPDGVELCNNLSSQERNTYVSPFVYKDCAFGRKAVNTLECKTLWADIDVGKPTNSYPTLQDAVQGLATFVKNTGCRPTIVVHSGVGLQVYWTLSRPLVTDVWKRLAKVFGVFCKQQGLIVDPACDSDPARVLRMPGTRHLKSGNIASVCVDKGWDWEPKELFALVKKQIKDSPELAEARPAPQAPALTVPAAMSDMTGMNVSREYTKAKAELVVRGCPCMLTAGLSSEPQWFAAMAVLRCCEDGLEWAHKVSATDTARYNPEDTEKKFYHALENSPSRCSTFEAIAPSLCAKCPHKGKITSPVQLGGSYSVPKAVIVETPAQPVTQSIVQFEAEGKTVISHLVIPEKFEFPLHALQSSTFSVDQRGIIMRTGEQDPTTEEVVYRDTIICTSQLYYSHSVLTLVDDAPRRTHWFVAVHPNGRRENLPFVIQRDMNGQNIMRWFNEANMFPTSAALKSGVFMSFMSTYIQSVVDRNVELVTLKRLGWTPIHDPQLDVEVEGFAVGKGVVTETGLHPVCYEGTATRIAKEEMGIQGNLEQWKMIPKMYTLLDQKAAQLAMCLAFAAPLMRYGAGIATSAVFSLWSKKSGKGKSQVMRACASIWGDPDKQFIQRNSSPVLRMRKLATIQNLPCFMDELTDVKDEDMYSLAYTLVDGREKQKLKATGADMVETGDWKTVTFTTANKSFKEAASRHAGDSEASILRVMEIECDFQSYEDKPEVQAFIQYCIDLCRKHYGVAGPEFMYQVFQHRDRLATLTEYTERWRMQHKFPNEERYTGIPLALAMKAGRWAKEWGLIDWDMDALEQWVVTTFAVQNRMSTATHMVHHDEMFKAYLMERQPNTLIVQSHERPVGEDAPAAGAPDKYVLGYPSQSQAVYIRIEDDDDNMYIALADLKDWCIRHRLSTQVLISELNRCGIHCSLETQSISDGLRWMRLPPTVCLKLNITALEHYLGCKARVLDQRDDG